MKKNFLIAVIALVLFSGCLQSSEHVVIREDLSGEYRSMLFVPKATMELIDTMMGGMIQAMSQAFGGENASGEIPESVAEEMFSNREELDKKIAAAGGHAQLVRFDHRQTDAGLGVVTVISFDNFEEILNAGIMDAKLKFYQDGQGNRVIEAESDPQKEEESKMQVKQVETFQESEDFKAMDPAMQKAVIEAFRHFSVKLTVAMPYEILSAEGPFKQVNATTAQLAFSGDILNDPSLMEEMFGAGAGSGRVVWKTSRSMPVEPMVEADDLPLDEAIFPDMDRVMEEEEGEANAAPVLNRDVTLHLKNGMAVQGTLLRETEDSYSIDIKGVAIKYYKNEVDRVE